MSTGNENLTYLDQEFLFILEISKDNLSSFENDPDNYKIIKAWIDKLSHNLFLTQTDKINRNSLLCGLASCMQSKKLTGIFMQLPKDPLPKFQLPNINQTNLEWLDDIEEKTNDVTIIDESGGKDCRSFVSTKLLDEGRGAMAYVALSVSDEGDSPWTILSESYNADFDKLRENIEKGTPEVTIQVYRNIVYIIDEEISGHIKENTSFVLETILQTFIETHKNIAPLKNILKNKAGKDQRDMLLQLLKAKLMDYIIKREVGDDLMRSDTELASNPQSVGEMERELQTLFGDDDTGDEELTTEDKVMLQRAATYRNSIKKIGEILRVDDDNVYSNMSEDQKVKLGRTLKVSEASGARRNF